MTTASVNTKSTLRQVESEDFDFVIVATGQLNIPRFPNIAGVDTFGADGVHVKMHTARWKQDVSLAGKRVGVIGTGPSAVQVRNQLGM